MITQELTDLQKIQLVRCVENQFRDRVNALGTNLNTQAGKREEAAYLCGAMAVLNVLFPNAKSNQLSELCLPRWVFGAMSGQSVLRMPPYSGET